MINTKIIKIASYTKNTGLSNNFTHKSTIKNSLCGDFIKTEFIIKKSKVKSMRYETESCILCEASASLLARIIKNLSIKNVKKNLNLLNNLKNLSSRQKKLIFPKKFLEYKYLIKKENFNRLNCILLPFDAVLKALKK